MTAGLRQQRGTETGARVCLVTTEFAGPQRNGGIAVMLSALAELLVAEGHDVTVLCLNGTRVMDATFAHWRAVWAERGVRLEPMPAPGSDRATPPMGGIWSLGTLARRWHVLTWLDARAFDLVHFNDWGGEALLCATARRQGLALTRTRLVLGLHGASDWTSQAGDRLLSGLDGLVQMEMERLAPARVDAVWAPGRFMPDWLAGQGAAVPGARLMPQLMPDPGPPMTVGTECPVEDIVLFGRLEDRKGLAVLLDALDQLAQGPQAHALGRVLFLGRAGTVAGRPAAAVVADRARAWSWPAEVLAHCDRESALEVLRRPGRLALVLAPMENCPLTLLECLALGVPVLASDGGGIPDLIDPSDHDRVLVPYRSDALADRLTEVLGRPFAPARPVWGAPGDGVQAARAVWRDWHRQLLSAPAAGSFSAAGRRGDTGADLPSVRAQEPGACTMWAKALVDAAPGPLCLLTADDRLLPGALETLCGVLTSTGADILSPGWCEGPDRRVRICLDGVPATACLTNVVAGPGLVLGERAREVARTHWDPNSGLWGLVAACVASGCRHEAVPKVVLERPRPWLDSSSAQARAPRLWAGSLTARDGERLARAGAALTAAGGSYGPGADARARATVRRDRRRARALWQSWPWRWTRPLRNAARRRRGEAPEPEQPPPLLSSGEASQVLWGMLVSKSWALMAWPRLMIAGLKAVRRLSRSGRRGRPGAVGRGRR